MSADNSSRGLPKEQLEQLIRSTPEARLRWLEEAQEFVRKFVDPKKIERWKRLKETKP